MLVAEYPDVDRSALVRDNHGLVYSIAAGFRRRCVPHEDLIQEGFVGLALAAARFDPARRLKFSTYAFPYIRGHMLSRLKRERRQTLATDRAVTLDLDGPASPASDVESVVSDRDQAAELLAQLPARLRLVVRLRFGLDGCRPHLLREAGEVMGLHSERVRQLEARAFVRMRAAAGHV